VVQICFFVGAIGALGGAIAVVLLRNPFYSVLALVVHLVSLAGLFLLLHAQFVAAAQVVVYAGAALFIELSIAVLGTALSSLSSDGPNVSNAFGAPASIGNLLLERFLIVFEGASMLLLVAAVGAVVLAARRKDGEGSAEEPAA
jgi:NADH-quinone oxidoreductase subunit J